MNSTSPKPVAIVLPSSVTAQLLSKYRRPQLSSRQPETTGVARRPFGPTIGPIGPKLIPEAPDPLFDQSANNGSVSPATICSLALRAPCSAAVSPDGS